MCLVCIDEAGFDRSIRSLIRIDPPWHHRRHPRKSTHAILTRLHHQLILRVRQIAQYQSLLVSRGNASRVEQLT